MLSPAPLLAIVPGTLSKSFEEEPSTRRFKPELMPVLREEEWPLVERVVHRRLLAGPGTTGPWLTFAMDYGDSLVFLDPKATVGTSLLDLEWKALANLSRADLRIDSVRPGMVSVAGEYASEALLLPAVMDHVHRVLGSALLAVAVPKEGGFLAVDAGRAHDVSALISWTRKSFDEGRARRISPLPLIVDQGRLVGLAYHGHKDEKIKM